MSKYLYDAKTNAFYPIAMRDDYENAGMWPEKGIEVDEDVFASFQESVPGKIRAADKKGNPVWVDAPEPSKEQLIAMTGQRKAALLTEAQSTISLWQTELQLGIISDDDKASLIAWMKYIQALNAVDTSTAPDIEWPVKPE
ncbi:TPA: tail fiber assembly protein [Escherichia coli]|uniref:tail fiber assembly protein n=1 Tax=Escherichia coli TaxID=562 RepID=UPI0017A72F81|nr:tail fiber assembly protein [Escherichia coli]EFB9807897.1 tail fiber assembly protein [Escherichia coli]EFO1372507.1 tail fiber assembly protein [Escherichia coli]ELF2618354.1 tail fiber assembly protein [Escherichia coli]MDS1727447.1 tail fiber assembly protein [Escherichia coli]HBA9127722.1 tail fiber assembly protein [Escherichia coli]